MLFQFDFTPFMFIKGQTIFANTPQPIKLNPRSGIHLEKSFLRAFEIVKSDSQLMHVYGFNVEAKSTSEMSDTVQFVDHSLAAEPVASSFN